MKFGDLGSSRFLTKDDVGEGLTLTVSKATDENLAQEGEPTEIGGCLCFSDHEKMLVVKPVNGMIIQQQLGLTKDDDLSACVGCRITLYTDHSVMFKGKLTGGIRVKSIVRMQAQRPATLPPVTGAGSDRALIMAARQKAWEEYKAPLNGQTVEEITPAWRELLLRAVPGKSASEFSAADWNKVRLAISEPVSPLSDEPQFQESDIPF